MSEDVLLGLIQKVDFSASIRQLTDGDRHLTVEELQDNAQKTLDDIADACSNILDTCDTDTLDKAVEAYLEWRKNRE